MLDFFGSATAVLLIISVVMTIVKNPKKKILWISTLLAFIGFVIVSPPLEETSKAKPTVTKSAEPKPVVTKSAMIKPEDNLEKILSDKLNKNITVSYWEKDCVMIKFPISDNLFRDSIVRGGQKDIITILSEYKKLVWDKDAGICISGTFPAIDQYGNINKKEVAMMVAIDYDVLLKMNLGNMQMNPKLLDNDIYNYILMAYMRD